MFKKNEKEWNEEGKYCDDYDEMKRFSDGRTRAYLGTFIHRKPV